MKVLKVTRTYYDIEDERVFFPEPLDHDISISAMQKLVDAAEAHVNVLLAKTQRIRENRKRKSTVKGE